MIRGASSGKTVQNHGQGVEGVDNNDRGTTSTLDTQTTGDKGEKTGAIAVH
jgi:hypothetical protein